MDNQNAKHTVSVIIPTYNRSMFISNSINSILKQTFQEFEIIVVDDSSTDNTKEIVIGFNDNRIKYIQNKVNRGAAYSRNVGIEYSNGHYLAFLDDDDEWTNDKLELQIEKFSNSSKDIGLIYCGYIYVNDGIIIKKDIQKIDGNTHSFCLNQSLGSMSLALIRHDCIKKIGGFDTSLPSCQDWDLWIRLSSEYEFDYVDKPLVIRNIHGNQITANVNLKIQGRKILLKKYIKDLQNNKKIYSSHLGRLGSLYSLNNNNNKAKKYFYNAIANNPYNMLNYIHLILSIISADIH